MARASLVAILIAAQGIPYLASGLTLCLHADGGFCLEQHKDGHCSHHGASAKTDRCCSGAPEDRPASDSTVGDPLCDCTHLAIADQPQMAGKVRRDEAIASHLVLGTLAVNLISGPESASAADLLGNRAQIAGGGPSAALSFLAPVMLRC
jgi:hypothetical protein